MPLAPALVSSLLSLAAAAGGWREVPLEDVMPRLQATVPARLGPAGIELDVGPDGARVGFGMAGVRALELTVETDGLFNVVYAAFERGTRIWGPPARYVTLRPGATTLRLDLVETADWDPGSVPVLLLDGSGHVAIRSVRILSPVSPSEATRLKDEAKLWGPESFAHTTVNTLSAPFWSFSRGTYLATILAGLLVTVAAAVLVAIRLRRRRWAPATALAAAALATAGVWNLMFLERYVPAMSLAPSLGTDARLRAGFRFAPELGEVAAAARASLRPEDRVGVIAPPKDWFLAQTLCYTLAPRPCVRIRPGEDVYAGISEIEHLRSGQLDVVVSFRGADELPPEFVPKAQITPRALIARRR